MKTITFELNDMTIDRNESINSHSFLKNIYQSISRNIKIEILGILKHMTVSIQRKLHILLEPAF